ncbi:MAG TPA: Error-prone repair protein ImuA [Panacibacter sp.]|nr:Error-prone repair protein ImuA [Panacibacter sp.]
MLTTKANIIARLQKDISPLQGYRSASKNSALDTGLGPIKYAFPNATFPIAAIHEFISTQTEDAAATKGFMSTILASLMRNNNASIWISNARNIFPPSLKGYDITPDKIIFIQLQKEKDILWVMEEALKCEGLAAVIAEIKELSFTDSRRLQLAVEKSQVTGFIIRNNPRSLNTTACVTRWKITALPAGLQENMPGVGFPHWNIELLKVRNGKPGNWHVACIAGQLKHTALPAVEVIPFEQKKKAG